MLPSASLGDGLGLYEPIHGSAPDLAGQGIANPIGAIASAALLLRHAAGLEQEAIDVEASIVDTARSGYRTFDLDPDAAPPGAEIGRPSPTQSPRSWTCAIRIMRSGSAER